eukprot:5302-Eustigmatos_ZCMA.PRE.1
MNAQQWGDGKRSAMAINRTSSIAAVKAYALYTHLWKVMACSSAPGTLPSAGSEPSATMSLSNCSSVGPCSRSPHQRDSVNR